MAQSDQNVQNAGFPTVRADINDNLAALFSQSSGSIAPSVTVAFQPWVDISVSPPLWKVRNASNNAWITIGTLDPAGFGTGGLTAIANGGTGQTTATAALTALLPSQTGNSGKALITNGSVASWGAAGESINKQVFTANGTWTKPSSGTVALITVWGSGGGGARGSVSIERAGGGGGGGCCQRLIALSDLPSTVAVTIATGGVGATTAGSNGGSGGTSYFGTTLNSSYAAAAGGTSGTFSSSSTSNAAGGNGGDVIAGGGTFNVTVLGLGAGGDDGSFAPGYGGGGGGGYQYSSGGGFAYTGGSALFGGGGGGAVNAYLTATDVSNPGLSINGGNGGAGSLTAGVNGQSPGGGGGGGLTSGGNGGDGLCIVYVW